MSQMSMTFFAFPLVSGSYLRSSCLKRSDFVYRLVGLSCLVLFPIILGFIDYLDPICVMIGGVSEGRYHVNIIDTAVDNLVSRRTPSIELPPDPAFNQIANGAF